MNKYYYIDETTPTTVVQNLVQYGELVVDKEFSISKYYNQYLQDAAEFTLILITDEDNRLFSITGVAKNSNGDVSKYVGGARENLSKLCNCTSYENIQRGLLDDKEEELKINKAVKAERVTLQYDSLEDVVRVY